jgi:hypothetical protein
MSQKTLAATMTAALAVEAVAATSPFGGKVYLPPPRVFLAIWLLWFILGLVAATGPRLARLAGQFSLLLLLTMAVVGPFGRKALDFLTRATTFFPTGEAPA